MKSSRDELKKLTTLRLREAKTLLDAGMFDGAYYLAGLAVECALKACIAKKTQRYDFPDRQSVLDSWNHDPKKLVRVAELQSELDAAFARSERLQSNWSLVSDWSVDDRYQLSHSRQDAYNLYRAIVSRESGVLTWIKKYW